MVKEIRLYVEGDPTLRQGFDSFLHVPKKKCRERLIRFDTILCRSCSETCKTFCAERPKYPDATCLLLVDSEGPVSAEPRQHLKMPKGGEDTDYHLMVEMMEA